MAEPKKRSRLRRVLFTCGILLLIIAVLLVFAPFLISTTGLGRSMVTSVINGRLNGSATVSEVKLSWTGDQRVRGLIINQTDGAEAANLDLALESGLLPFIFGRPDQLALTISGRVAGTVHADGSTSFTTLIKTDPNAEPISIADLPAIVVNVDGLAVALQFRNGDAGEARALTLDQLVGAIALQPRGESKIDLTTPTTSGDLNGRVTIKGSARDVFDQQGNMTPAAAQLAFDVNAESLPYPFPPSGAAGAIADESISIPAIDVIRTLSLSLRSTDLTDALTIEIGMDAPIEGSESSHLKASVVAQKPFAPDGSMTIGLASITGEITGERVPTSAVQFALGDALNLEEAIGALFDVNATFSSGADRDITAALSAPRANLELAARVLESGAVEGERLVATVTLTPALLAGYVAQVALDQPAPIVLELTSFTIPAAGADGVPLREVALNGSLTLPETLALTAITENSPPQTVQVADAAFTFNSDALANGLTIIGGANIEGGTLTIDERITKLFNEKDELAFAQAIPVGQIELRNLPADRLRAFIPAEYASRIVNEFLVGTLTGVIVSDAVGSGLGADVNLTTQHLNANVRTDLSASSVRIGAAEISATITPELAAALQAESEDPVALASPTTVNVKLDPFALARNDDGGYDLPARPISGTITADDVAFSHSALTEPLLVRGLNAAVTAQLEGKRSFAVKGAADLRRSQPNAQVASLAYDISAELPEATGDESAAPPITPRGTIAFNDLDVAALELVTGQTVGAITGWVGERGSIAVEMEDVDAAHPQATAFALRADLTNLKGAARGILDNDALTIHADELATTIAAARLESMLNPPATVENETPFAGGGRLPLPKPAKLGADERGDAEKVRVENDVAATLNIPELRIPLDAHTGEAFDPRGLRMDIAMNAGPLTIVGEQTGARSTLRDLALTAKSDGLGQGLAFTLTGLADVEGEDEPGVIDLRGILANLVDADSKLAPADAQITMTGDVAHVPTIFADRFLALNGLLVAAVGVEMNTQVESDSFSRNTGRLEGRITTPNGFLVGVFEGWNESLRTTEAQPLQAELEITPPLRQRLLEKLNPIFADVRTTEQPLRMNVPGGAVLPLDGDISRLNGNINITVGKVEFDSGSSLLKLLKLFNEAEETIPGSIDPIAVKIRDGVVTYDRFTMTIDKYRLEYQGTVNLVTKQVELRTQIPLDALARTFQELEGYADKIIVPLLTHGELGDLKTEIDPKFDLAGAALRAGVGGALQDLLKKNLPTQPPSPDQADQSGGNNPFGSLIGDLLRGVGGSAADEEKKDDKKKDDKKKKDKDDDKDKDKDKKKKKDGL